MSTKKIIIFGLLGFLVIALIGGCSSYNGFSSSKNQITGEWGEVENQYQRRLKLYKNVIATIKGSAKFEKSTLENLKPYLKMIQMHWQKPIKI
jgi:LemA protein